jgi:hypothetical protein
MSQNSIFIGCRIAKKLEKASNMPGAFGLSRTPQDRPRDYLGDLLGSPLYALDTGTGIVYSL